MRHAYLILAHNEYGLLQRLVSALDDSRNDIYVHFDRKCRTLPDLRTNCSKLYIYSEVSVYWGDSSMIEAEFLLFRKSAERGYDYYHLLSGVDFPIKSNDYIDAYCKSHEGIALIDSYHCSDMETVLSWRTWNLFPHRFRYNKRFSPIRVFRELLKRFQIFSHILRNNGIEFRKGAQWLSLPDDMLKYVISKENESKKIYTHTFGADECFVQTILFNSPFRERAFVDEWNGKGNARYIDWSSGDVKVLSMSDLNILRNSDALFARKFSSKCLDVIDAVEKMIGE